MFVGVFSCLLYSLCVVSIDVNSGVCVCFCVLKPMLPWNCGTGYNSVLEMEHRGAFVQAHWSVCWLEGFCAGFFIFPQIN